MDNSTIGHDIDPGRLSPRFGQRAERRDFRASPIAVILLLSAEVSNTTLNFGVPELLCSTVGGDMHSSSG